MARCPICKKDYSKDFRYCPECEVGIIPDSTDMLSGISQEAGDTGEVILEIKRKIKEKRKKKFVQILKTEKVPLAGLIKDVLENHGIFSYIDNYFSHALNTTNILFPDSSSGVKIMVYEDDAEEAEHILSLFFGDR